MGPEMLPSAPVPETRQAIKVDGAPHDHRDAGPESAPEQTCQPLLGDALVARKGAGGRHKSSSGDLGEANRTMGLGGQVGGRCGMIRFTCGSGLPRLNVVGPPIPPSFGCASK